MRRVDYTTYWAYADPGMPRQAPLLDFVLDIVYFIAGLGVIPPLHVLNEMLQDGGNNGGMGPGTMWQPFTISLEEYQKLVEALLNLDGKQARKVHPYVTFDRMVKDETLNACKDLAEWQDAAAKKYLKWD